ncbi:MAG: FkbM family methyltransferase [Bacteroidales bacterium]
MRKLFTFVRYFKDFIGYGQYKLVFGSIIYLFLKKSVLNTRICRGKLGYYLHRKGTLDFQFGNYAYEWAVKQFILKNYKDYSVFIDVGANMGTYTLLMQAYGLKTISFEPSQRNYKALLINLMLNNFDKNAVTYNLGLSTHKSHEKFTYDPLNTGASHLSSVTEYDHDTDKRATYDEVDLVKLDDMIETMAIDKSEAILIKIDVEGMEKDVLIGASEFIKTYPKILFVIESVHSGEAELKGILGKMAEFQYFEIDHLNFAALKTNNL